MLYLVLIKLLHAVFISLRLFLYNPYNNKFTNNNTEVLKESPGLNKAVRKFHAKKDNCYKRQSWILYEYPQKNHWDREPKRTHAEPSNPIWSPGQNSLLHQAYDPDSLKGWKLNPFQRISSLCECEMSEPLEKRAIFFKEFVACKIGVLWWGSNLRQGRCSHLLCWK